MVSNHQSVQNWDTNIMHQHHEKFTFKDFVIPDIKTDTVFCKSLDRKECLYSSGMFKLGFKPLG